VLASGRAHWDSSSKKVLDIERPAGDKEMQRIATSNTKADRRGEKALTVDRALSPTDWFRPFASDGSASRSAKMYLTRSFFLLRVVSLLP
jgi:hypothetical protein